MLWLRHNNQTNRRRVHTGPQVPCQSFIYSTSVNNTMGIVRGRDRETLTETDLNDRGEKNDQMQQTSKQEAA